MVKSEPNVAKMQIRATQDEKTRKDSSFVCYEEIPMEIFEKYKARRIQDINHIARQTNTLMEMRI
jgi:hypothetical protein